MKLKKWLLVVAISTILIIGSLGTLVYFSTTNNILYIQGQDRLKDIKNNPNAQVILLGDSSLANAINNKLLTQLIDKEILNLWTTGGGHNLASTYNLLRHVLNELNQIQTIIIMQTPSVYGYEFLLGGYFSTLGDLDSSVVYKNGLLSYKDYLAFHFLNLPSIKESLTMQKVEKIQKNTKKRTYKNGEIPRPIHRVQTEYLKIGSSKKKELQMIDKLLEDKNITVVYIQGPLHNDVATKYNDIINQQQKLIKNTFKNIIFVEAYLYPKNSHMGNTIDHVDRSYQNTVTKYYYKHLNLYINRETHSR